MKHTLTLGIFLLFNFFLFAQNPSDHKKHSYVDNQGQYYQPLSSPVYLFVSSSPDEKPTPLQSLNSKNQKPVYLDGPGGHTLTHLNRFTRQMDAYRIFADGFAPVSTAKFLDAPYYFGNKTHFYGANLTINTSSIDDLSGLNGLYHATDQQAFTSYSPIGFNTEGKYTYRYYSVDNVGNVEKVKSNTFIVDLSSPHTYHHIIGISSENVISTNTAIYLTKTDSLSGVKQSFYSLDSTKFIPYYKGYIPFQYLEDGNHTLYYYSVDQVNNTEKVQSISFYLDKTAPIMSADILGDRFLAGDKVYFSGRTKLKLTAVDNKSGIKELKYSIDKNTFVNYDEPFYLPGKSGIHSVHYYAVDKTDNFSDQDSYNHSVGIIYLDLTGPALNNQFVGSKFKKGDTLFVNSKTLMNLTAMDPESGFNHVTYTIDKQGGEVNFTKPFTIADQGVHTVDYFGYDNVNNRNVKQFVVIVDNDGPEIQHNFSIVPINPSEPIPAYPSFVTLYLSATDLQTGSKTITYSINNGAFIPYTTPLKVFEKKKEYTIKIKAVDNLGNETTEEITFKTAKY